MFIFHSLSVLNACATSSTASNESQRHLLTISLSDEEILKVFILVRTTEADGKNLKHTLLLSYAQSMRPLQSQQAQDGSNCTAGLKGEWSDGPCLMPRFLYLIVGVPRLQMAWSDIMLTDALYLTAEQLPDACLAGQPWMMPRRETSSFMTCRLTTAALLISNTLSILLSRLSSKRRS